MKNLRCEPSRARLWTSVIGALLLPVRAVAGDLGAGQSRTILAGEVAESWTLHDGGALTIDVGASALNIMSIRSFLNVNGGSVSAAQDAVVLTDASIGTFVDANIVSSQGRGLIVIRGTNGTPSSATATGGYIGGATYGVSIAGAGSVTLDGAMAEGTSSTGVGLGLFMGSATIRNGSSVKGQLNGITVLEDERGVGGVPVGRTLVVDGSRVEGVTGAGLFFDTLRTGTTDGSISIVNGSEIRGGNGIAVDFDPNVHVDILVEDSHLFGDVRVAATSSATFGLRGASTLTGAMNGDLTTTIGEAANWSMTGDSAISSLEVAGGTIAFAPTNDGSHRNLTIHGDLSGSGSVFALNTAMNEGGALANQATDRVLVEGNVTTTAPIELVVTPTGAGALTDTNQNGLVEAGEGISLVQVAGSSRADAFALRGGYVAAGPWQYTLHAFGPGETDAAQNVLANGTLNWDYRLGNRYVCADDCPVDPEVPPVDPPVDPEVPPVDPGNPEVPEVPEDPAPPGRIAVVPQLPSYLSAPAALLTYGDMLSNGLHQRLGDLRTGTSTDPVGGEVFARYLGGQLRYTSNLSFQRYGYDFDQQVNALQLGGSLIALDGDNGSLRAGWAADHGTTRVTPKAADGASSAKYRANGVSGWLTWQHGSGLWVDGVVGATRFRGDVGTDLRGADVGRVRANGWTMSVEAGMPIALGGDWTVEPRFQLKHQSLTFRDFTDRDGLDVRLGTAKQTNVTLGGRLSRTAVPLFMPYVGVDLTHTSNGDPKADVSNADWDITERFGSGRVGNSYRVAAGAVSQLSDHVQVYGEGTYQHFVGSYGMRGWAGNLGLRITF